MDIKKIYVVFGENFNAKIFKKLITVEKYMKQNENLQFKGFFSEELAT
jgi:hypothetical protein